MHKDYVVVDIETTGLEAGKHRMTEIAAIKVEDGQPVAEFSKLIRPYRRLAFEYLPREITDLTGITMEMLASGFHIEDALLELKAFIGGDSVVLGHNLKRFDMGFLQKDFMYFLDCSLDNELVDSVDLARSIFKQKGGNSLQKLAKKLEIGAMGPAHRALADCHTTHALYVKLLQLQNASK